MPFSRGTDPFFFTFLHSLPDAFVVYEEESVKTSTYICFMLLLRKEDYYYLYYSKLGCHGSMGRGPQIVCLRRKHYDS
jgi:hypothetical protein